MNVCCEVILWAVLATLGRTELAAVNPLSGAAHRIVASKPEWSERIEWATWAPDRRVRREARYYRNPWAALDPVGRESRVSVEWIEP